jgi:hypothetical protein
MCRPVQGIVFKISKIFAAGNVLNFEQIKELRANKVWAFTIGGAVLEKKSAANGSTKEPIQAVLKNL